MRIKAMSACAVVILVFVGLRLLMHSVEPHPPGQSAVLRGGVGQEHSRNHLASFASLAAGAVAFAVVPSRRRPRVRQASDSSPTAHPVEELARCPHCDQDMRRLLIAAGEHRGRTVWLCPQSPDCEEVRPLARRRKATAV